MIGVRRRGTPLCWWLRGRSTHPYLAAVLPPPAPGSDIPCPAQHEGTRLYTCSNVTGMTAPPPWLHAVARNLWAGSWRRDKGECHFPLATVSSPILASRTPYFSSQRDVLATIGKNELSQQTHVDSGFQSNKRTSPTPFKTSARPYFLPSPQPCLKLFRKTSFSLEAISTKISKTPFTQCIHVVIQQLTPEHTLW